MCGILCSIWQNCENQTEKLADYMRCKCIIQQRGPDSFAEKIENLPYKWKACFAASVLWMQGPEPVAQPCTDSDGNILLWNGDIFSGCLAQKDVSDTQTLQNILKNEKDVPKTLTTIRGPYSVIYYQAATGLLYFARDSIGRHSLLLKMSPNCDSLTLMSSASTKCDTTIEVPAIGIFVFNLKTSTLSVYPWRASEMRFKTLLKDLEIRLGVELAIFDSLFREKRESPCFEPEPKDIAYFDEILFSATKNGISKSDILCPEMKPSDIMRSEIISDVMKSLAERPEIRERIERVMELLKKSIMLRVQKKPKYCKNCVRSILEGQKTICDHSKLGILFSGGLDSTILAALADDFVPRQESIDLVNVAFEKVRRVDPKTKIKSAKNCTDIPVNFDVPDRKTGRQALAELQEICPWRTWNFVECNVTQEELQKYRSSRIRNLVYPLTTILDDSLGCALWFASRGSGTLFSTGEPYNSPTRVLLLGMGADELFGGYTRHRTTLRRGGWSALSKELDAELARISERNLGRDDRVVADHGRQSRLPYLDEDFVSYVSSLRPWERCYPVERMPAGLGDKLLLRLVAHEIGLRQTAHFPKRAFQFGSRIANSKENAKDVSKWL